jgi:hypothetical protein
MRLRHLANRIAALHNEFYSPAQEKGNMPSVDTHRGFLLPVPPYQLFPSGGFDLHTSWATDSDGPFFFACVTSDFASAERFASGVPRCESFSADGDCAMGDIEVGIVSRSAQNIYWKSLLLIPKMESGRSTGSILPMR